MSLRCPDRRRAATSRRGREVLPIRSVVRSPPPTTRQCVPSSVARCAMARCWRPGPPGPRPTTPSSRAARREPSRPTIFRFRSRSMRRESVFRNVIRMRWLPEHRPGHRGHSRWPRRALCAVPVQPGAFDVFDHAATLGGCHPVACTGLRSRQYRARKHEDGAAHREVLDQSSVLVEASSSSATEKSSTRDHAERYTVAGRCRAGTPCSWQLRLHRARDAPGQCGGGPRGVLCVHRRRQSVAPCAHFRCGHRHALSASRPSARRTSTCEVAPVRRGSACRITVLYRRHDRRDRPMRRTTQGLYRPQHPESDHR